MSSETTETHVFMCGCPLCAGHFSADDGSASAGVGGGASAPKPVFTLSQIETQLRTQWGGNQEGKTWTWLGTANVTYSIDTNVSGVSESSGLVGMTTLMEDRARLAFELWDDVIALSLTEAPGNANANITFNYSSNTSGGGTYAWWNGYYAPDGNFGMSRAYVWLNSGWSSHNTDVAMAFGGYGFMTYLHEIGHTLGLSHPGTYNAGSGGPITYANSAEYAQDSHRYTVMSYFYADDAEPSVDHYGASGAWEYASTPLLHDIAALQAAYGADMTTRTGNTTYGFNANAGRVVFDFTQNTDPIIVIWDAGGTDTLDCSGYSTNQVISLIAGSYSNVGYLTCNVAIAFDCTIENATGGSGADTISGNSAANIIIGNAGNDIVTGGGGDDILYGGLNTDIVVFSGSSSDYRVSFNSLTNTYTLFDLRPGSPDGTDQVNGFEVYRFANGDFTNLTVTGGGAIVGTSGNDTLIGTSNSDSISGFGGVDMLFGGAGDDWLQGGDEGDYLAGGDGNDTLAGDDGDDAIHGEAGDDVGYGGNGNDVLVGYDGDDNLNGGAGNDTLIGCSGSDTLNGDDGNDQLFGYEDADFISGGKGDDFLAGGAGNDTLNGGDGVDSLHGDEGDDILNGEGDGDVLVGYDGDDTLNGGAGNDTVIGNAGDDTLNGDDGNDQLFGYEGADTMNGGAGADFLAGGTGNDVLNGGDDGDVLDGEADDDQLFGGAGGDNLNGNDGNDQVNGGAGNDGLLGGNGNDTLNGNEGNDFLIGGDGNDTFVFENGTGSDLIVDMQAGEGAGDVIDIRDYGFADLSAVLAASSDVAGGVYIRLDDSNAVFVQGVSKAQFAADDFILV